MSEAVERINRHPFTTHIELYDLASDQDEALIWDWNKSPRGSGMLAFPQHGQAPVASWISLSFPQPYSLAAIIAAYGEPSHVMPSFINTSTAHFGNTVYYDLRFIYLTHGFYVETEQTFAQPPQISPHMLLAGQVTFFQPTTAGLDAAQKYRTTGRPWGSADLVPWQGFVDFASYCRLAPESSDPEEICGRAARA